jgi:hypothetical protein
MEDGASFKKWGCYTPILPKDLAHSPNFQKKNLIKKFIKKKNNFWQGQASTRGWRVTVSRRPALARQPTINDPWSPCCRRPTVGVWLPGHDQTPVVGRRQSGDQGSPTAGRLARASRRVAVARRLRVDT